MQATTLALRSFGILISTACVLSAQTEAGKQYRDLGIEVGATPTSAAGFKTKVATPLTIRTGRSIGSTSWQFDTRITYTSRAASGNDRLMSVGVGANVSRRIAEFGPAASLYLTGGPSLTLLADDAHSPTANVIGMNFGVGRRHALGQSAAMRTEVVATHDFASYRGVGRRATNRIALRFALFVVP